MTATYVRRLFDQHAPDFDTALERLDYRGPQLLREAVRRVVEPLRFGSALDLGCGTGLAGAAFRPCVDWLVGVDLSPAMIAQARAKGLYDRLLARDMVRFLREEAAGQAQYHLVIAADVFVYLSDLAPVVAAVAAVLAPGGVFAFTVEAHGADGVRLQPTLRYAHGVDHVRAAVAAADLTCAELAPASTRTEKGVPVDGLVAVARREPQPRRYI
jgi:predicted TPR repeat methyltransferase